MTDPIERVARAVEQELDRDFDAWLERWGSPAGICEDAPDPPSKYKTSPRRIAQAVIRELTEQGVPVAKLLSGEMVAVDKETPVDHAGHDAAGNLHAHVGGHCFTRMAHLDYAGNPPVEPAGATHSQRWTLTGPAQPPEA